MWVKRCARVYKGKVSEGWWLVKSYREDGKVKHKYIENISHLSVRQRDGLKKILKNPKAIAIDNLKEFIRRGYDYGNIVFFLYMMHQLGIVNVLSKFLSKKSLSLIVAVLLNRLLKPSSKMEAISWIKGTVFPFFCSLRKKEYHPNRVYEAMDEVKDNMDGILEEFYKLSGGKPLFLLYDITSIYFEGEGVKKGKRGYSRDYRPDRPQVLLGIVLNEKGFPVHFEIFDGNLRDKATVEGVAKKVKKRFNTEKAIFVGDRGMISIDNVEKIVNADLGYIMALTHEEAKDLLKEKEIDPLLFDKRLPITLWQDGEDAKYVLCGSEFRRERDIRAFRSLLEKGRESLEVVKRMVEKGRLKKHEKVIRRAQKKLTQSGAEKYFDFRYENGMFEIIEKVEVIERSERLCGYYILKTSETQMEDYDIEVHYKKLQEVERCFRDLKELIEVRPVCHWKDRRVETHIFLCLLAQVILAWVRKRLKEVGWLGRYNTLEEFINLLGSVKVNKVLIEKEEILVVQRENPLETVLLKNFGLLSFDYERDKEGCSI
ncbi:MAG: IS1634 family transposase [Methanosarcinales archaeon]